MYVRSLYICYFGLEEPLVYSQVLPYLRELAKGGVEPHLLTFERFRPTAADAERSRVSLARDGILWHWLRYHKAPSLPATLYDIAAGALFAMKLGRRERIEVLHARAHLAMAMALLARCSRPFRLVFDVRGLVADEYADAGIWRQGSLTFRVVKLLERVGLRAADEVIVLTERLRSELVSTRLKGPEHIEVIPCCIDTARFLPARSPASVAATDPGGEIVYAGSVTGLYLLEEIVRFFQAFQTIRPEALLRVLTKAPPEQTASRIERLGLRPEAFWVGAVPPEEIPRHLARACAGVSFRKATLSQIGASPTKIPEYLAAGIPVVANSGIGDSDEVLTTDRVGVIVKEMHPAGYRNAAEQLQALLREPNLGTRCQESARLRFDLQAIGGARYRRVYRRLCDSTSPVSTP